MRLKGLLGVAVLGCAGFLFAGCAEEQESTAPPPPAPPEYADKHMPAGWWADEKIIAEGKEIFEGVKNIDVNCSSCHGKDGKPVKAGARDFRKGERMKQYSDSVWFWRISEGVPNTKMKAWKSKLTDENDRWKVMAYERTFGLKGLGYDVARKEWVPVADLGKAAPAGGGATPAAGAPGEAKPAAGDGKAPQAAPTKEAPKKDGK
jgi:mono/diheme cytochrome c family protein